MDFVEAAGSGATGADVTTEREFHELIRTILQQATANGVDVRGGWLVHRDEDSVESWDVEITKVRPGSASRGRAPESPIFSIVEAVSVREGVDPIDLPPLHDAVDTDFLAALPDAAACRGTPRVTFQYCGYTITVRGDGSIVVDE